jgi:hypothetical protein
VERIRRTRSKWVSRCRVKGSQESADIFGKAHDYRIGQEQLYEALERVLNDLKSYTVGSSVVGELFEVPIICLGVFRAFFGKSQQTRRAGLLRQ